MDPNRFDDLVQSLTIATSRRNTVLGLLGGIVASVLPDVAPEAARRKDNGVRKKRNRQEDRGGVHAAKKGGGKGNKGGGKKGGKGNNKCKRKCKGKQCGPDRCGGACGTCGPKQRCAAGKCVPAEVERELVHEFVGKSYVAPVVVENPGNTQVQLMEFIFGVDDRAETADRIDPDSLGYRMRSAISTKTKCDGDNKLVSAAITGKDFHPGYENLFNWPTAPPNVGWVQAELTLTADRTFKDQTCATYEVEVQGVPDPAAILLACIGVGYERRTIALAMRAKVCCDRDEPEVSITGTEFPSLRAFVDGMPREPVVQGPMESLLRIQNPDWTPMSDLEFAGWQATPVFIREALCLPECFELGNRERRRGGRISRAGTCPIDRCQPEAICGDSECQPLGGCCLCENGECRPTGGCCAEEKRVDLGSERYRCEPCKDQDKPDACHECVAGEWKNSCIDEAVCCGDQCCGGCLTCKNDQCVPGECDECFVCDLENGCIPAPNGGRDPRCPDGCHTCHFGQCLDQCTGNNETCCGETCCEKCFVCSPDGQSCVRDPECPDQDLEFTYSSDGLPPWSSITARPGELITFSLTLHADAPILADPNDPFYGPTFVIRPCKDIDPHGQRIECEGGGPAPMDSIIPGATWDVTVGDHRDGSPSVGHFSWRVPDDVPATTYEIVFLIRYPDSVGTGGGCCHKVWLTTAQNLQVVTEGFGRVTSQPAGINCSLQQPISDCVENARIDSTVELTATPFLDAEFVEWRGCNSVDGRRCTVKMDRNRNPNAVFTGDAFFWRINGFENPSSVRARRGEEIVFTMQAFVPPSQAGSAPPYEFQLRPCKLSNFSCEGDTGQGTPIGNIFPGATWESTVGTHERASIGTFRWLVPEDYPQAPVNVHFVTRMATGGGGCCDVVSVGVV